ncbi:protein WEAK CHLOROPLAST MOVEMENT UNDER BLUE LIGHT-like 2 [Brassica rapa]|uniref:protein WEAK CHLOROPLAST MOVEMENT UNDER BLUE LIGHT-like 2 n=1 Tax=Brassica campestris TaxID=3711 RepID=UPI00142D7970|nr:protein WEAK CHLOROPLAST MOVEMENT UNDER BLUE LIGHT-like 2 [Brassica rapa]
MELDMTCSVIEELKLEVALAEKEQAKQDANVAKLRVKKMEGDSKNATGVLNNKCYTLECIIGRGRSNGGRLSLKQFHSDGLRRCMISRLTRRNAQGESVTLTNQELARLERTIRQQPRQTDTTMGDHANQEQLTAQLQQMQQQMLQMQQTIQAQQDAVEQTALARQEQHAKTVPIGQKNLPCNILTTRSKKSSTEKGVLCSANKKEESDCSKKENSSDTQKIGELTVKVDQLLKNNQGHVFNMEQATAGQIQNQNQRQPQNNRQAVPATENSQPDELKGMGMMMQQLLQGQQVQAKVLNQFAQTVESIKRQQETLPGRTDRNPRTEHCNAIEQPFAETVLGAEENTEQSASSGVTGPSVPAETPPVRVMFLRFPIQFHLDI